MPHQVLRVSEQLWLQKVSVILWSYPTPFQNPVRLLLSICVVEIVCACAVWTSCLVQTLKFKTMQCTVHIRNRFNGHCVRKVARSTCTSPLSLFRNIWMLIKHYTTVWWPTSRFIVAGTSCTHPSQLFSKKNLWNEKVAKEPKSSQIKILEPTASKKNQISGFWLQKSQSANPVSSLFKRCSVKRKTLEQINLCYKQQQREVTGVTISNSDSAPVPKFLNPSRDTAIFQIWESESCSDCGCNHRFNRNLPMFFLKKWPHRLLLLPKLKSDSWSGSGFSQIFDYWPGSGSERKTQNPARVDSGSGLTSGTNQRWSLSGFPVGYSAG